MDCTKRKVFTLEQRVEAIRLLESGTSSQIVDEQFFVSEKQVQQTLKRKAELMM